MIIELDGGGSWSTKDPANADLAALMKVGRNDPAVQEQVTLSLRIENYYLNSGDTVVTTPTVTVPYPPGEEGSDERDAWEYEHIFAATGTGRTDGDATYDVEVIASSDEAAIPVGTTYEFGY